MALVNLVYLVAWPDHQQGDTGLVSTTLRTLDAAGEYDSVVTVAREDMTISHVGLNVTIAGSPTLDVRVETVSTVDGLPTGTLWGANTNIVTGTLVAGFTLHTLTAPASISRGQVFAIRANYLSGTSVATRHCSLSYSFGTSFPYEAFALSAAPVRQQITAWLCWALGSSATTFYPVFPLLPFNTATVTTITNVNGTRRGARFRPPFKCRCAGLRSMQLGAGGDFNYLLLDDAGTILASKAVDASQRSSSVAGSVHSYFDSQVILNPGVWYRAVVEPTTSTACRMDYGNLNDANYRMAWPGGLDWYLAEYTTAGGWVDSTDKVPATLDLLFDQLDDDWSPPTYISGVA